MKRYKKLMVMLLTYVIMALSAQILFAEETGTTSDGFKWTYADGTMSVTGYEGTETILTIPSTINEKKVTKIGPNAFCNTWDNRNLNYGEIVKITIPNTVRQIDNLSFNACLKLTDIIIPNSVKEIGNSVLDECDSLTSITIPDSVTKIGNPFLSGCDNLQSVKFSSSLKTLDGVCNGCPNLKNIIIPNSVTRLDSAAFSGCTSLESVTIPESVRLLFGFLGCTNLKYISIQSPLLYSCSGIGYMSADFSTIKIPDFSIDIEGYYGTHAELYAIENGFNFIGVQNDISNVFEIIDIPSRIYSGEPIELEEFNIIRYKDPDIKQRKPLIEGTDYEIHYSNNINAGTASVTVTGINHFKGSIKMYFTIRKAHLNWTVRLYEGVQSYTGKEIKPKVLVTWNRYDNQTGETIKEVLTEEKDYTVTYKDNINVGTATVIVNIIKDNYEGSTTMHFEIVKKDKKEEDNKKENECAKITEKPCAKDLIYNGNKQELILAGSATGGEIQYVLGTDKKTAPSNNWSLSIPTATNVGTYYVWYKVVGDKNHKDTEAKCIEVQIAQKGSENQTETDKQTENEKQATTPSNGGGGSLSYITDSTPSETELKVDPVPPETELKIDPSPALEDPTPNTTAKDKYTGVTETISISTKGKTVVKTVEDNGRNALKVTGIVSQNGTSYAVSRFATRSFSGVCAKNIVIDLNTSGSGKRVTFMPNAFEGCGANKLSLELFLGSQVKFKKGALSGSGIKKILIFCWNEKEFKDVQKNLRKSGYKGKIVYKGRA